MAPMCAQHGKVYETLPNPEAKVSGTVFIIIERFGGTVPGP